MVNNTKHKQQGVALITALVITAIAISIATSLAYQQYTTLRLSSNLQHLQQAYLYNTGMENWAKVLLRRDFNNSTIDDLTEDWATEIPAIPIPGGFMKGKLTDLQGRLNLNDIISKTPTRSHQTKANTQHIAKLTRLFIQLELIDNVEQTDELIDNLVDWLDADSQTSDRGAESNYYRHLKSAYLAANTAIVSPSELRLIKGFDQLIKPQTDTTDDSKPIKQSIMTRLLPYVNVLPKNTTINVNTASKEVLLSLGALVTADNIDNVVTDRIEKPFTNVNDFLRIFPTEVQKEIDRRNLSVTTEYFLLTGKIEIGNITLYINSIINRDRNGNSHVIRREFSEI